MLSSCGTGSIGTVVDSRESERDDHRLDPAERLELALQAFDRSRPVTEVAVTWGVSRKCVYEQKHRAEAVLTEAFCPEALPARFRGWLEVTAADRDRMIVSAALHAHGSVRGICEHVEATLGVRVSEGEVSTVIRKAAARARTINQAQDLSGIREGAHDEIFAQGTPVLVGVEPRSFFVYGLEASTRRDEVAWWAFLEQRRETQGLRLQTSVSDGARGIRAGVEAAFPGLEQRSDILHAQLWATDLETYLENQAYAGLADQEVAERRMVRAKDRSTGHRHSKSLALARTRARAAVALYDEVRTLLHWLAELFALVGPPLAQRRELYDWIVAELAARPGAAHRITPVVRYLKHQRDGLLAFVQTIEQGLARLAGDLQIPRHWVEAVYQGRPLAEVPATLNRTIQSAVDRLLDGVLRASSAVENINSILAGYFYLRRSHGAEFLDLLQFYLNHRRFRRSERPERVGKSPRELLTGQPHADWLELLGYPPVRLHRQN